MMDLEGQLLKKSAITNVDGQMITRELIIEDDSGVATLRLYDGYAVLAEVLQEGDFLLINGVFAQHVYNVTASVHLTFNANQSDFPLELSFTPMYKNAKREKTISYATLREVKSKIGQHVNVFGAVIPAIDDSDIITVLEGEFVMRLMDWSDVYQKSSCELSVTCARRMLSHKHEGCVARLQNIEVMSSEGYIYGRFTKDTRLVFFSGLSYGRISATSIAPFKMTEFDWKQVEQLLHMCSQKPVGSWKVNNICDYKQACFNGIGFITGVQNATPGQPLSTNSGIHTPTSVAQLEYCPALVTSFRSLVVAAVPISSLPGIVNRCSFKKIFKASDTCPAVFLVKAAVINIYPASNEVEKIIQWICKSCKGRIAKTFDGNAYCNNCCTDVSRKKRTLIARFSLMLLMCDEWMDTLSVKIQNADAVNFLGVAPCSCVDSTFVMANVEGALKKLCPFPSTFSSGTILLWGYIVSQLNSSKDHVYKLVNTKLKPGFAPYISNN